MATIARLAAFSLAVGIGWILISGYSLMWSANSETFISVGSVQKSHSHNLRPVQVIHEKPVVHELKPVVHEPAGVKPVVHELAGVKPVVHELAGAKPVVHELAGVKPVVHGLPVVEPIVHEMPSVEPVVHELPGAKPVVHEIPGAKPVFHEMPSVEPVIHELKPLARGITIQCPEDEKVRGTINDDYCDCPHSGADEPLTGACSQAPKFECLRSKQFIHASRINDGVCDCCDGSDESAGANCMNRCEKLSPEEDRNITILAAMRALPKADRCDGCPNGDGGSGIWSYLTIHDCLLSADKAYRYCPFRGGDTAIRIDAPIIIGRGQGSWVATYKKIRLFPGDECAPGKQYVAFVEFECAPDTKLIRVNAEACTYHLTVTTPASC